MDIGTQDLKEAINWKEKLPIQSYPKGKGWMSSAEEEEGLNIAYDFINKGGAYGEMQGTTPYVSLFLD